MNLAAQYIAFMMGEKLEEKELDSFKSRLNILNVDLPEQSY